ncbi:hypothetical protein D1007_03864 [Hordeum vulgare]|nr:hypothetical protein D1007_03864 [Hordeum vulgare]
MEQDVALMMLQWIPLHHLLFLTFTLWLRLSKVSPTLNPNISHDDDVDDNEYEDKDEESDDIASLKIKGEMILKSLYKNKLACSNFMEIMSIATERKKYIEELEAHLEEHEDTIERMEGHERDYANEIAELSQALENEPITKESLEETFALELYRLKESHDRSLEVANYFRTKNDKLEVAHTKLLEDYEHLENGSRLLRVPSSSSPSLMLNLKRHMLKIFPSCLLLLLFIRMLVLLTLFLVKHPFYRRMLS